MHRQEALHPLVVSYFQTCTVTLVSVRVTGR
jgi:hypothetical protein